MTPPPPIPIETLLRHAGRLRSLARGLLDDEHAAEDIVQETLVVAMQHPPADRNRLGAWLRTVARRLALQRRRGEGRRAAREERVSAPPERDAEAGDGPAPPEDVIAKRQVLRTVLDAVLELDEPYQSVVLARYLEDLLPLEIAARRRVSVATVKSQLGRAMNQLRQDLDADAGGRRQWAVALAAVTGLEWSAPAPVGASPTSAGSGTLGGIARPPSLLTLKMYQDRKLLLRVWHFPQAEQRCSW